MWIFAWLTLDACAGSNAPTAEPAVAVSDSDSDSESRGPSTDSENRGPSTDSVSLLDDSIVPDDPVVVRLFGIDGCPAPPPTEGVPRVRARPSHGPYSFAIVRRVIRRSATDALRGCYSGTEAHAACRNVVTADVELWMAPDGSVRRVRAAATDSATARCVERALAPLTFPEPDGGGAIRLRFPLRFRVVRE